MRAYCKRALLTIVKAVKTFFAGSVAQQKNSSRKYNNQFLHEVKLME